MSLNLIDQAAQRKRIDDLLSNPVESAKELESLRQQLTESENLRKGVELGMDCANAEAVRLRQQLASRDAEVERYASALLHVRKALCGDIHNTEDILDLVESLNKERDKLREQVKVLRDVMSRIAFTRTGKCIDLAQELFDREEWAAEALAATEPKP